MTSPPQAWAHRQGRVDMRPLEPADWSPEGDIAGLRRVSGVELVLKGHFGPVIDGRVLTEATDDVFETGRQHPVPLLAGTNLDEGSVYATPAASRELPAGPGFDDLYPAGDDGQARHSGRRFTGESRFVRPVWHWARTHHRTTGAPTWMYRFTRRPPLPPALDLAAPPDGLPDYGVHHTAELPYVLDNLDQRPWPWRDTDRQLAAVMADAWARFVISGDPGGGTLPGWPVFTGADDAPVMVFGDTVEAGVTDRVEAMHLLGRALRTL